MTLAEALHAAQVRLQEAGIDDADLEAEVLLRHALGVDRAQLYARLRDGLDDAQRVAFQRLVERRLTREPAAYIVGHKEFYGIDLEVTPDALVPRPETELLVDEALGVASEGLPTIADVGTGCGAIAVALATHLPQAVIYAIDESERALALAARNVERRRLAGRVRLLHGDLLDPLPEPVDLIVANLPYVKTSDWEALPPEIRDHEPRAALDGGPSGTRALEGFLRAAPLHLRFGGRLLAEIGWDEGERLLGVARECFPAARITVKKDLAGLDRIVVILT
ncbi:MAG TPA: peptide chain release factor N(5)-glutamine methyltransferase [Dehalococcoidia bacterium]|nr:peptide chain release factor N(5)-glutamine methyltransferase [Dehalococcoidia bacterium]